LDLRKIKVNDAVSKKSENKSLIDLNNKPIVKAAFETELSRISEDESIGIYSS
jgi:hypothetical protein